eukprot:25582-Lingulodinium_polyedra.AAC.1
MRNSSEHVASTPALVTLLAHWSRKVPGGGGEKAWAASVDAAARALLAKVLSSPSTWSWTRRPLPTQASLPRAAPSV